MPLVPGVPFKPQISHGQEARRKPWSGSYWETEFQKRRGSLQWAGSCPHSGLAPACFMDIGNWATALFPSSTVFPDSAQCPSLAAAFTAQVLAPCAFWCFSASPLTHKPATPHCISVYSFSQVEPKVHLTLQVLVKMKVLCPTSGEVRQKSVQRPTQPCRPGAFPRPPAPVSAWPASGLPHRVTSAS